MKSNNTARFKHKHKGYKDVLTTTTIKIWITDVFPYKNSWNLPNLIKLSDEIINIPVKFFLIAWFEIET